MLCNEIGTSRFSFDYWCECETRKTMTRKNTLLSLMTGELSQRQNMACNLSIVVVRRNNTVFLLAAEKCKYTRSVSSFGVSKNTRQKLYKVRIISQSI